MKECGNRISSSDKALIPELYFYYDKRIADISKILKCSDSTVLYWIRRYLGINEYNKLGLKSKV